MAVYAGTTADRAQETLDVCQSELVRLRRDVTAEELIRAKTVLKGRLFTIGDLPEGPRWRYHRRLVSRGPRADD